MNSQTAQPRRLNRLRAVLAVWATYVFFLIFAQFAFLELLHQRLPGGERHALAAMGLSGLVVSVTMIFALQRKPTTAWVRYGLLVCALLPPLALVAQGSGALLAIAAIIGAALAVLTVSLACSLTHWLPRRGYALTIGLGTGLAYLTCNIPAIFAGSPAMQAWTASAALALAWLALSGPSGSILQQRHIHAESEKPRLAWVLAALFCLIWLDSACFAILQQTPALKAVTWTGQERLWLNGVLHAVAAVAGGWFLDRGYLRPVLIAATACLITGAALTHTLRFATLAADFYVVGVSLYSTALVAWPGMGAFSPWRAGLAYGVGGWIGSALGIGMALDLQTIPFWFLGLAGCWMIVFAVQKQVSAKKLITSTGAILLFGICLLIGNLPARTETSQSKSTDELISRGRAVYVAEGCIHCHSQYVRPQTMDVELWGPYREPTALLAETPPILGNRRQGPDLLNVGLRRGPMWQTLHLKNPRQLSPHSAMPSYKHLFNHDDGAALVAYLNSLGSGHFNERWQTIQHWQPAAGTEPSSLLDSARLFQENCQSCHGPRGHGDGPLAKHFSPNVRNLVTDTWHFIPPNAPDSTLRLARIIKFGMPGTEMPGHETLSDEAIMGLARWVDLIHHGNHPQVAHNGFDRAASP